MKHSRSLVVFRLTLALGIAAAIHEPSMAQAQRSPLSFKEAKRMSATELAKRSFEDLLPPRIAMGLNAPLPLQRTFDASAMNYWLNSATTQTKRYRLGTTRICMNQAVTFEYGFTEEGRKKVAADAPQGINPDSYRRASAEAWEVEPIRLRVENLYWLTELGTSDCSQTINASPIEVKSDSSGSERDAAADAIDLVEKVRSGGTAVLNQCEPLCDVSALSLASIEGVFKENGQLTVVGVGTRWGMWVLTRARDPSQPVRLNAVTRAPA